MTRTTLAALILLLTACAAPAPKAQQVYSAPIGPTLTGDPLPAASLNP